ncbi:MAG TPA: hypothetical protein VFS40_15580 [Gemmatimonadales bacterium]|nr:hypothetical protein [Gemmatimonadales bacterium]
MPSCRPALAALAALVLSAVPLVAPLAAQAPAPPAAGAPDSLPIDTVAAQRAFAQARAVAMRDGGGLWGVRLDTPLLIADPQSRVAVAARPDAEGRLAARGSLYVGVLPPQVPIANTASEWAGTRWTMVVWPLPADTAARGRLLAHELFHGAQPALGFVPTDPANVHLDRRDGRLWLRLELRALRAALTTRGPARRTAIADALRFRAYRRALAPGADSTERALELNEGLAAYTGARLEAATAAELAAEALRELARVDTLPSLVRGFAYGTGPAYGALLDARDASRASGASGGRWRRELRAAAAAKRPAPDLAALLAHALRLPPARPDSMAALQRARAYGYAELARVEDAREARRVARQAELRRRFVEGPVLVLPLAQMRIQMNPGTVETLDGEGTIYPAARLGDRWGVLDVRSGGLLVGSGWDHAVVPLGPDARDGWTLELSDGWRLAPGARAGDSTVVAR